jgi:hypothetical protein
LVASANWVLSVFTAVAIANKEILPKFFSQPRVIRPRTVFALQEVALIALSKAPTTGSQKTHVPAGGVDTGTVACGHVGALVQVSVESGIVVAPVPIFTVSVGAFVGGLVGDVVGVLVGALVGLKVSPTLVGRLVGEVVAAVGGGVVGGASVGGFVGGAVVGGAVVGGAVVGGAVVGGAVVGGAVVGGAVVGGAVVGGAVVGEAVG